MKITTLIFLLFAPFFLFAQAEHPSSTKAKKIFLDADIGVFLNLFDNGDGHAQISLNGGYLLNQQFGVGLEGKYLGLGGSGSSHSATGLGGFIKYEYKGFYLKPSFGKILYGTYGSDYAENEKADFVSAGYYFSGTMGYRLKSGLLLGIQLGHADRVSFDYYVTADPYTSTPDPLIYQGISTDTFNNFCLVVGYTWPRRLR